MQIDLTVTTGRMWDLLEDSYPNKRDEFLARVLIGAVERQQRPNRERETERRKRKINESGF